MRTEPQPKSAQTLFRAGVPILATVILVSVGLSSGEAETPAEAHLALVRVAEVEAEPSDSTLPFAGTLQAVERAALGFEIGGRLAARPVSIGDFVDVGQELARLEATDLRNARHSASARVAEAMSRVEQLQRDLRRVRSLASENAVTREEVEQVESASRQAMAFLDGARSDLVEAERRESESVLKAPFAGRVQSVQAEPGERLGAGEPVVWLAGEGELEVEIGLPESLIGQVAVGTQIEARLPFAEGVVLVGWVVEMGRGANPRNGLYPVTISLTGDGIEVELLPGMSVDILLPVGIEGELSVPLAAIQNPGGGGPRVIRVVEGLAERVPVVPLRLSGGRALIRGELQVGDQVVVAGAQSLLPGQRVEVLR